VSGVAGSAVSKLGVTGCDILAAFAGDSRFSALSPVVGVVDSSSFLFLLEEGVMTAGRLPRPMTKQPSAGILNLDPGFGDARAAFVVTGLSA